MFITEMVLHKCRRFYLKGIETLRINPTLKTQIVLGTNGSGKSSLLKVGFSVLPADKDDFEKGGYKYVKVMSNGRTYELRSDIARKVTSHSFIMDGEELNEGKTGAVQRELVREHFGMTNDLHQVLTGQIKFTSMSALQRREWITLLSSADFDYVIKLHGRIKRAARDTGAVIKHLSGRLVQESSKKIDDDSFTALRRQSEDVYSKLMKLHQHSKRDGLAPTFGHYERMYNDLHSEMDSLIQRTKYLKGVVPTAVKDTDNDAVIALKDNLRSRVQMLEAALQEVSERHHEIDKQIHDMADLEDIDPVELDGQIKELRDRIADLNTKFKDTNDIAKLPTHEYCFATIQDLMTTLHQVDVSDESYLDRSTHLSKLKDLADLQGSLVKGQGRIGELEYRLDHIRNCASITCPKCTHEFKEGVSGEEEETIRKLLEKGYAFRKDIDSRIDAVKEWIASSNAIGEVMYSLQSIREQNPDLSVLWERIHRQGGFKQGRALISTCTEFIGDIKNNIVVLELTQALTPLLERQVALQKLDKSSQLRGVANSLSDRVLDLKSHLLDAKETLKEVDSFHSRMIEAGEISQTVEMGMVRLNELMDNMTKFVAVEEVEAQVKRHQVQLGMLEQSLAEAEIQIGIVKDLNKSLEEAKSEEDALIQLEKLLSPKDGIIAEQIMVFINTFIGAINDVIAKVWGYNLALDKCNLAEGELDYKFPMYIHSTDNPIEDIKFGSDSQVDIVNQAFVLVVYKFLELQHFPLYLDELGRTFDEVHRLNLTLAVKELMDDDIYSQVFFISHSFESQNSYPNSQLVVLDDSHVSLNRISNEHVEII